MTGVDVVPVALGARSYEVRIGAGLIGRAGQEIAPILRRKRVAIVTDETVAPLHLAALEAAFAAEGIATVSLALPAGESTKGWPQFARCVEWLLEQKVERRDVVVAFGGGVIGDLVGFASAVLRRGVRFVQIPTTLLAQVDSSVGGKTGINTAQGKNLVGAFHQPSLVLADIGILESLPKRDFLAGYGEVVKYGLLGDAAFFDWLEVNGPELAPDRAKRQHAVRRSVEMKADIVARDETEEGDRALLNLGHTFCHALEKATGYSDRLLHGEGVALGMVLAARYSARIGLMGAGQAQRVEEVIAGSGLPARLSGLGLNCDGKALAAHMLHDKKMDAGTLPFVLMKGIGHAFLARDVELGDVAAFLDGELVR